MVGTAILAKHSRALYLWGAACGVALALAAPAWGDSLAGSLESDASATDRFEVTCSDDGNGPPLSLVVSIEDTAPVASPLVSAQILKGNSATNTTDDSDANALAGPAVFIDGGAGDYNVFVDKTGAGDESYLLSYACMTGPMGSGVQTGTSISGTESGAAVPLLSALGWWLLTGLLAAVGACRARRLKGETR